MQLFLVSYFSWYCDIKWVLLTLQISFKLWFWRWFIWTLKLQEICIDASYTNMESNNHQEKFLKTQLILAVIPSFVTPLFAFYRIRKLTNGIIIELIIFLTDLIILMSISSPFGMMIVLPISVLIPVYYVRKWTLKFNKNKSLFWKK